MNDYMPREDEIRLLANLIKKNLDSPTIRTMTQSQLRREAIPFATRTSYGSYTWRSSTSSRIAPKTVYLGSDRIALPSPSDLQKELIRKSPEELEKIVHLLETLPFVAIERQMCCNNQFNLRCTLLCCVADPKNVRLPYMWSHTMFPVRDKKAPHIVMIHIPEEHQIRQQVLAIPEANLNIALATDYMGEDKKGFLRQAMWLADQAGHLGLHAGTKMVKVKDPATGKMKRYGVYLFGLSATGKSTWSCHQLGLDIRAGELTEVTQDDVVFLRDDGGAFGTENNFYVKTDVTREMQEAMYNSLIHSSALMDNVLVDSNGRPDFLDESLCGNGRAVIQRKKLRVRYGWRMKKIWSNSIDLPPASELDGLIFAFITRRNTIMPFSQKLTADQAVLAYLWGESSHSYASQPDKAGESVRTVGTDPFIIGSRAAKVNRFYDIVKKLQEQYPDKVSFYQYNTGGVGEIIETSRSGNKTVKKLVRKVQRVPISVMAAIQRGDLRGTNLYEPGRLGTLRIAKVLDADISAYDVGTLYSQDQITAYIDELVQGRRAFTEQIAMEGLKPEIMRMAEKAFEIESRRTMKAGGLAKPVVEEEKPLVTLRRQEFDNTIPRSRLSKPPRLSSRG